jgi:hypothetical protein
MVNRDLQVCYSRKQNIIADQLQIQVNEYLDKWGDSYDCEDKWWGDKKLTWEAALERAWNSRLCNGKMHGHQRRVAHKLSEGLRESLKPDIYHDNFNSFHDLYSWIELVASHVNGIGSTTTYDIARRLGVWIGLMPEVVYLHAGTAEGARKLGVIGKVAPLTAFPKEIQELGATHAENFLCIYKDAIRARANEAL